MTNYFLEFKKIISCQDSMQKKKLLLHSCCAPCSSASLERVLPFFDVDIFYYNPNITSKDEFDKRLFEQKKFVSFFAPEVKVVDGEYDTAKFYNTIKGYEKEREGGARCFLCYRLRLEETAKIAKQLGYDFFATTLTLSPLKNASKLNEIGFEMQNCYGVNYLPTDFKKENGYLRSIKLSSEYSLYRQNYCGCVFSLTNDKNNKN